MEIFFVNGLLALLGIIVSRLFSKVLFKVLNKFLIAPQGKVLTEGIVWNVQDRDIKFSLLVKNIIFHSGRMSYIAVGLIFMISSVPLLLLVVPAITNVMGVAVLILLAAKNKLFFESLLKSR